MISGNRVRRLAVLLHNWMGLLVGIQIIFWFVGGLVMTVLPLDLVRGERSMAEQVPVSVSNEEVQAVLPQLDVAGIRQISAHTLAGGRVLQVTDGAGNTLLYSGATGTLLSPIGAEVAEQVALLDFDYRAENTQVSAISVEWITKEPGDFRRALPVWRVNLDDPDGTRIYVSPDTGRVMARRNDYWRVFDFFWMLHIMDYDEREDFNHPLLIITTLTSTLFVFTGVVLLYFRFWPGARRKKVAKKT